MFSNAHSLPPLSAFTTEYRSSRLTPSQAQPLPTGGCRFILLHPSISNQRCTCQSFHHNGKPGSSCDCGHQACYHVHTSPPSTGNNSPVVSWATHSSAAADNSRSALMDRIGRLEQALEDERQARMEELKQEQRLRERDMRILREALHPFYRTEMDMRKKLVELEDRIEGNYDEQVQMKERLIEVDDAAMVLEKRLDDLDGPKPKRRRFGRKIPSNSRNGSPPSESSSQSFNKPSESARPDPGSHNIHSSSPKSNSPPGPPSDHSTGPRDGNRSTTTSSCQPRSPLQRPTTVPQPYDYSSVFFTKSKPNVDSATITQGVLAASMPMFHSSLALGSDPESHRTDDEDDAEVCGREGSSLTTPEVHLITPPEEEKRPVMLPVEDAGVEVAARRSVSVSDAACRRPG